MIVSRLVRLLLLLVLLPLGASATHIVGGELDLQHKAGSTYALTLNLYFDAINGSAGALDQSLVAGIFDKGTNQRLTLVTLPLTSNTFVQYTNPACAVGSLSTRKLVYNKDVTLDAATYASPAGYYVAVERCCRNLSISNIVNPGGAAQTFYLEFPAVVRAGAAFVDSTPRIFPPLGDYACRGELFYYDFGGVDPDGDSLAYDMVTPLNGHASPLNNNNAPTPTAAPYVPITWNAGLNANNQIPGTPALGIDARTGRLTVRARDLGLFVFGVRCAEYRRGVKIGETRRDFQLYVLNCPTNTAPTLQMNLTSSTGRYRPGRDTLRLAPGGPRCLTIRYTDPDPSSVLTMTTRPVNFTVPAVTFTTTATGTVRAATDTLTTTLCFPECTDTQGKVYLLDLIVADNGCSLPKHDTLRVAFTATQPPNAAPVLTSSFPPAPLPISDDAPAVVRVPLGQRYTATLAGLDADRNALALTATGAGFDLAAVGMQFAAQNGTGQASATFSWEPSCAAAATAATGPGGGLLVHFRLAETGPCTPLPQTRAVRFEVVPVADAGVFKPANVITPNGDGVNDFFYMPNLPLDFCDQKFASIRIFSRWGQPVFASAERGFRWGGAGAGGLYYYLVTYTDGRTFKGWVEVIR